MCLARQAFDGSWQAEDTTGNGHITHFLPEGQLVYMRPSFDPTRQGALQYGLEGPPTILLNMRCLPVLALLEHRPTAKQPRFMSTRPGTLEVPGYAVPFDCSWARRSRFNRQVAPVSLGFNRVICEWGCISWPRAQRTTQRLRMLVGISTGISPKCRSLPQTMLSC
jgi:hypothetical protein